MLSRSRIIIVAIGIVLLLGLIVYSRSPKAQTAEMDKTVTIGFYNVENLFDTIDDPLKDDEQFLPSADRQWTQKRYDQKIVNLGSVIKELGGELPAIVGLCEVENQEVLKELVATPALKKGKYKIVHFESPDQRGIDVAMIYRKNKFNPESSRAIKVHLPDSVRPTRDILYVKGKIKDGPEIHLFVNHWPSRYRGMKQSEPKRLAAAAALRQAIDSVTAKDSDAHILCMGDFNDYPHNRSLTEVLDADSMETNSKLVNLMSGLKRTRRGSYNYKGNWDFLDQIIVSRSLTDGDAPDVRRDETAPYFRPEMVYENQKYGDIKTSRTYAGSKYFGGYSDHLPVYTKLAY